MAEPAPLILLSLCLYLENYNEDFDDDDSKGKVENRLSKTRHRRFSIFCWCPKLKQMSSRKL